MAVLDFFAAHPVFTREEFAQFLRRRRVGSARTAESHLLRYLGTGRIGRIKRGVYFAAAPGETVERASPDFPLVASRLTPDAVLGYHTALEVHGYAQSLFERLYFLTTSKVKPFKFRGRAFVPVTPSALLAWRKKERAFLDRLIDRGEVDPGLLTSDPKLRDRIATQPMFRWKAIHVRCHRGVPPLGPDEV